MKTRSIALALAAALALASPAAFAQSADKPMTDKELTKFIADWPAVAAWFADRSQKITQDSAGGVSAALFTGKDFEAFIGKRGWSTARFSYVAGTAFWLVGLVKVEKENPDLAKQFDDAIAQVQASDLPADEKAQNIKSLEDAKKMSLGLSGDKEINQAELRLVRARYDEVVKLIKER
jgi:hypothetical protein